MLTLDLAITQLTASAQAITALVQAASSDQARWHPDPDSWTILEVINHLYDEEREDFRQRVDYILHRPTESWPPIDPQGWVTARAYNQRDLADSLANFQHERDASLVWLKGLSNPNWESVHVHPRAGSMTARDMLGAWVVHDHLHIRQLNELHWQYLATQTQSTSTDYAGGW